MRAKNAYWIFVLIYIEYQILIDLFITIYLLFILYFKIPPAVFDVSVCNDLDLSYSFFIFVVSDLEVSDKIIVSCLDKVDFAIVFDEIFWEQQLSWHYWAFAVMDIVCSFQTSNASICIVNLERSNGGIFFSFQDFTIIEKLAFLKNTQKVSSQSIL